MATPRPPSALIPSTRATGPLSDPSAWQVVLVNRGTKQVVLHNARTSEFAVSRRPQLLDNEEDDLDDLEVISQQQERSDSGSAGSESPPPQCPTCCRPFSRPPARDVHSRRLPLNKDSSYFNLLSEESSRANTPRTTRTHQHETTSSGTDEPTLDKTTLNTGYFATFFEEIQLLGRGGAGSVHLVRHVLNGEQLGLYACKKGQSKVRPLSELSTDLSDPQSLLVTLRIRCEGLALPPHLRRTDPPPSGFEFSARCTCWRPFSILMSSLIITLG